MRESSRSKGFEGRSEQGGPMPSLLPSQSRAQHSTAQHGEQGGKGRVTQAGNAVTQRHSEERGRQIPSYGEGQVNDVRAELSVKSRQVDGEGGEFALDWSKVR